MRQEIETLISLITDVNRMAENEYELTFSHTTEKITVVFSCHPNISFIRTCKIIEPFELYFTGRERVKLESLINSKIAEKRRESGKIEIAKLSKFLEC